MQGPEQELIKAISLSFYDLAIENFYSLIHIFLYCSGPEVDSP